MTIEKTLLKALSSKKALTDYKHLLNPKLLANETNILLKDYEAYYLNNPDKEGLDYSDFKTFFFTNQHPYLSEKEQLNYNQLFQELESLDSTESVTNVLRGFEQQEFYARVQQLTNQNIEFNTLRDEILEFEDKISRITDKDLSSDMDLELALEYVDRSKGMQWRCEKLRNHFNGGLINGDLILIAGYSNVGKSSFLASELGYMAQQLRGDDKILWLTNEDSHKAYVTRLYCSVLERPLSLIKDNLDKAKQWYTNKLHGDPNRVIIQDIQGWHVKDIERLIKSMKPKMLAIDMLDNVNGFDKFANKDGAGERYQRLYQWAREMATQHCPILVTTQTNRNGSDTMYPPITELRQSGVDKQGAAKVVIMIGALEGQEHIRYLSTPKFKLEGSQSWRTSVKVDLARSLFL